MNRVVLMTVLMLVAGLGGCRNEHASGPDPHHAGAEHAHEAVERGPHGGRLLHDGDFALELQIFEDGVPPEFRIHPTSHGAPIAPGEVEARVTLSRIDGVPGGDPDVHTFTARDGYLLGSMEVHEPHSFDVAVSARHDGRVHTWSFESPEARVRIADEMAAANGVKTAVVGAGAIRETIALYGVIRPNAQAQRDVSARYPGVVRSVEVRVGDAVKAGERLATIESNESLQVYAIHAPIAGTITQRHANPGEAVGGEPLFEVADFSSVWAQLSVFPRDRARLSAGQRVDVAASDGAARGSGRVGYISPVGTDSQALVARVELDNRDGPWTPGQFVDARVAVAEAPADVVVPLGALQTLRDWDVVFVVEGQDYQALPVTLGRRDGENVEVTAGLSPGARVVVANSFLLKADVEKSGAAHEH